jgi:hypothetical protein
MTLRLKPGVADRLNWSRPRDPVSYICSSCGRSIDFREHTTRIMGPRYAVICDECVEGCFERADQ